MPGQIWRERTTPKTLPREHSLNKAALLAARPEAKRRRAAATIRALVPGTIDRAGWPVRSARAYATPHQTTNPSGFAALERWANPLHYPLGDDTLFATRVSRDKRAFRQNRREAVPDALVIARSQRSYRNQSKAGSASRPHLQRGISSN